MKALTTFMHGSTRFKIGDTVDLNKIELAELLKVGLIGETKKQTKSKKDGNIKGGKKL